MGLLCSQIRDELIREARKKTPATEEITRPLGDYFECDKRESLDKSRQVIAILPTRDNAGRPIKQDIIDRYILRIANLTGGVTVARNTFGCGLTKGVMKCEDNTVITTTMKEADFPTKKEKLDEIAKDAGIELGQESIFLASSKAGVEFIEGRKREELPEEKLRKIRVL